MFTDTMLPAAVPAGCPLEGPLSVFKPGPGLKGPAIEGLESTFPGTFTPECRTLLATTCGFDRTPLQYIDLTGQWHAEEPLAVFRPCLTLAMDDKGRRWVAETQKRAGLPGPVWCIQENPHVAVYISNDIQEFIELVRGRSEDGSIMSWLNMLDETAKSAWQRRGALVFQARQNCKDDKQIRQWLLQLPRDARVFDLRSPRLGTAWPYGVAGPAGRFHRCCRELLFAVSGFPAPTRWLDFMGELAGQHEAPMPASVQRDLHERTSSRAAQLSAGRQTRWRGARSPEVIGEDQLRTSGTSHIGGYRVARRSISQNNSASPSAQEARNRPAATSVSK